MNAWSSEFTHSLALLGVIGFAVLLVIGLTARIVWTRSTTRNQPSKGSESILGAIGGPSTYRAVKNLKN